MTRLMSGAGARNRLRDAWRAFRELHPGSVPGDATCMTCAPWRSAIAD
jgi:hypothetical protein